MIKKSQFKFKKNAVNKFNKSKRQLIQHVPKTNSMRIKKPPLTHTQLTYNNLSNQTNTYTNNDSIGKNSLDKTL